MLKTIKKTVNKVVDVTKKVIYGRNDYSPSCKSIFKQYGESPVVEVVVFRHPINSAYLKTLNAISVRKIEYDKLYHLGVVVTIQSGIHILIEKNEVIDIRIIESLEANDETIDVNPAPEGLTVNLMLYHCQEKLGSKYFT